MRSRAVRLLFVATSFGLIVVLGLTSLVLGPAFGVTWWLIAVVVTELVIGLGAQVAAIRAAGGLRSLRSRRRSAGYSVLQNGAALAFVIFALALGRLLLHPPLGPSWILFGASAVAFMAFEEVLLLLAWREFRVNPQGTASGGHDPLA